MKQSFAVLTCALLAALLVSWPFAGTSQEKEKEKSKGQEQQERLTLAIEGVECQNCARVITQTLEGTQLKVSGTIKPNTSGPSEVEVTCAKECDLGQAAAKVKQAATPHRNRVPPSLALVIFADLDEQSVTSAKAACQKIAGVEGCEANASTDEIQLKFSGDKKVTVPQILTAMKEAGVNARTTSPQARKAS